MIRFKEENGKIFIGRANRNIIAKQLKEWDIIHNNYVDSVPKIVMRIRDYGYKVDVYVVDADTYIQGRATYPTHIEVYLYSDAVEVYRYGLKELLDEI